MRKLILCNANCGQGFDEPFEPFSIGIYQFRHKKPVVPTSVIIYSQAKTRKDSRKHHFNASVTFSGEQDPSQIFSRNGVAGIFDLGNTIRERKHIEDVLLLASVITGTNWHLKSYRSITYFYPTSYNTIANFIFLNGSEHLQPILSAATEKIKIREWQIQFENGFHLIMLFNNSYIFNSEQRFLSNFVIWEWLFPHLMNPNGATTKDETRGLNTIMDYIFKYFFGEKVKVDLRKNIFYILRNQLAHSGKLPIDRDDAQDWMKKLPFDVKPQPGLTTVETYLRFFDTLTHYLVMKTLGLDIDSLYPSFFFVQLEEFLKSGKIDLPR